MFLINQAPAAGSVSGTAAGSVVFPLKSNSAKACILTVPASGKLEQVTFRVRAAGIVSGTGTSPTATVILQSGVSLTLGSNSNLLAGAADAVATGTTVPFCLEYEGVGSTVSGTLSGSGTVTVGAMARAFIAGAALSGLVFTPASGPDGIINNADPALNLVIGITFGGTLTAFSASLTQFTLEA